MRRDNRYCTKLWSRTAWFGPGCRHGGPNKAVYGYPSEHYGFWQEELPGTNLPLGMFGENFTTEGLFERDLHVGDRLQIG